MNWKELTHTELNQMLLEIYEERNELYMSIISKILLYILINTLFD